MLGDQIAHFRESDGAAQSVRQHVEDVAIKAKGFAKKIDMPSVGELIGLLHDLGKYSNAFQSYINSAVGRIDPDSEDFVDCSAMKGRIDHSTAGAQLVWNALQGKGNAARLLAEVIGVCIASHHSGLIDCLSPQGTDNLTTRMHKSQEFTHLDQVTKIAAGPIGERAEQLMNSRTTQAELTSRIKSTLQGQSSVETRQFALALLVRFLLSSLVDADRLDSADFENPRLARRRYNGNYPDWFVLVDRLERHISSMEQRNPIDALRTRISTCCKERASNGTGLYQLTVPTGGGKTLATLRFALIHAHRHKMDRVLYVIPYTSIIEQNASVVRDILESNTGETIVLEHHSNLTPERDTWQSKLLSENWDAPVVFTTMVQFLEAVFGGGTRGARRMHQLANSVIIFDEVQTVPIKTVHLFNNAINFLVEQCESTIILCTATQPLLNEVDPKKGAVRLIPEREIMSDVGSLFRDLRRVEVVDSRRNGGWTEDEVADCALMAMKEMGSALVVVNTKRAAQEIYRRCRGRGERLFHLTTYMCPAHRKKILDDVRACLDPNNSQPVICVSTQLIEAGVDVDFGLVIRYLAGLDSIAQAAGRCNRNGRRAMGRVIVLNPATENLDMLPEIGIAKEIAARVLDEYRRDPAAFDNDLLNPKAMTQFYRYYFFARAHEMAYPVTRAMMGRDDTLLSLLSANSQSVEAYNRTHGGHPPSLHLRQSFKTAGEAFKAVDAPTQGVVVPYGAEGKEIIADLCSASFIEKRFDLMRKAQRYSVNLFPHDFRKLADKACIREVQEDSGIMYLDERHYSPDFGVSSDEVAPMESHIV